MKKNILVTGAPAVVAPEKSEQSSTLQELMKLSA
jgi:hypothetical protein